jgi:hypothetical protein
VRIAILRRYLDRGTWPQERLDQQSREGLAHVLRLARYPDGLRQAWVGPTDHPAD